MGPYSLVNQSIHRTNLGSSDDLGADEPPTAAGGGTKGGLNVITSSDEPNDRDEEAFRQRVRDWLTQVIETIDEGEDGSPTALTPRRMRKWQNRQYDAGFVGITYPQEYGGQGLSARHEEIFNEVCA